MLRVGLTGDLGSGKSTVARLLAARGAIVLSSDDMARAMMQPGLPVYAAIVAHFGSAVLSPDHTLNRSYLAQLAFTEGRAEELNAIIHPAVLAEQGRQLAAIPDPHAIAVVESALIFLTRHAPAGTRWQDRFDRILLVTAPEADKIARFLHRIAPNRTLTPGEHAALEADARRRLALQTANQQHAAECLVIPNTSTLAALGQHVDAAWRELQHLSTAQTR